MMVQSVAYRLDFCWRHKKVIWHKCEDHSDAVVLRQKNCPETGVLCHRTELNIYKTYF